MIRRKEDIKMNPGDYWVGDKLYCGRCHKVKAEYKDEVFGYIYRTCDCRLAEIEAEQRRIEAEEFVMKCEMNRGECFSDMGRYKAYTLGNAPADTEHLVIAKKYVSDFDSDLSKNTGLLFFGSPGYGKTSLAARIANGLTDKGFAVKLISTLSLLLKMKNCSDKNEFLRGLNKYSLLILDDFCVRTDVLYEADLLFELLEHRKNASKPILITTNLTLAKIKEPSCIGERRIFERVLEMCPYPMEFKQKNYRRLSVAKNYEFIKGHLNGNDALT